MNELYCVKDESDDQLRIEIVKLPVMETLCAPSALPGNPPDGLPPNEAYVLMEGEPWRVLIGEEASEDPNIALRLAFRKIENYVVADMQHVAELHRNCSSLDQDRLTLRSAVDGLIATLDDASGLVHKLVCSVLDNN